MPIRYDDYVKSPGLEEEYTPEMIRELALCTKNRLHFIKKHIKIVTGDNGVVKFDDYMYDFQESLINDFIKYRFTINLCGRQQGKTTVVGAYAMSYACFEEHKTIGIVSNKEASAKSFLARVKYMYEQIPSYLKPGVIRWAEKSVEFDNHVKIMIAATSKDSFRGEPINLLICDELGFVDPPWKAIEFWNSNYPTISASTTSKIIIISTPNGMYNLFHRLYTGAVEGKNTFKPNKYDWTCVPGRDKAWADEQKANLGRLQFNQEYAIQFLGSSSTVIDFNILESLNLCIEEPNWYEEKNKLKIWEKPIQGAKYVVANDVAKGTGKDYSVSQILKIHSTNPLKIEQVAVFRDNYTDVYTFSFIIDKLCKWYNNAFIMVENNSDGAAVVSQLWWELENDNLVNTGGKEKDLGIRATRLTKPKAVLFMKKLIEDGMLLLKDSNTITELNDFIDKGNGKYAANNYHDDTVSALYWACYLFQMKDLIDDVNFMTKNDDDDGWGIIDSNINNDEFDFIIM